MDFLVIEIAYGDNLDRENLQLAVEATLLALQQIPPTTAISISIGGYDDDPRELYDIEDVRKYIIGFAYVLVSVGVSLNRFLDETQNLIKCCLTTHYGGEIEDELNEEFDFVQAVEQFQERSRYTVN